VQLLPEEQRPNFSAMLGGVQLQQVFLTLRSKTDRLVLKDASMTLTAGQAAIITSKPYLKDAAVACDFFRVMMTTCACTSAAFLPWWLVPASST
jgi:hypothetical protein